MDLISSSDTLDFLSKSAPRPWVKKMLLWMIFTGEIDAIFREGTSIEIIVAAQLLTGVVREDMSVADRREILHQQYDEELADQLVKAGLFDKIRRVAYEWPIGDDPRMISAGYFVFASTIDWEQGRLVAEIESSALKFENLFWEEDDLLSGSFDNPGYEVELRGFCFDRTAIEMMMPTLEMSSAKPNSASLTRIGRPPTWDWSGATTHLLTIAQKPDGLPTGKGAQAQIERIIADWFMNETNSTPAESLIRNHAAKIMRAIRPERP